MSGIASSLTGKRRWWVLLVAALLAAAAWVAVRSSAGGDDPAGRTLRFTELGAESLLTTRRGVESVTSQGDVIAFTGPLIDAAGARAGRLHWTCITTVGGRTFEKSTNTCHGVFALRDGTLTIQFNLTPGGHRRGAFTAAVTGGTGAYANARGVVISRSAADGRDDTITLVD
jgi:hypothetical protein